MENVTQLHSYSWRTAEFALCQLNKRAQVLADLLGLEIDAWQEDGLGDAIGFMCQSSSGLAIYAVEFSHATSHLGDKGPVIYVEAGEIVENGIKGVLDSVLNALSLTIENVDWIQPDDALEAAKSLVASAMKYRAERHG